MHPLTNRKITKPKIMRYQLLKTLLVFLSLFSLNSILGQTILTAELSFCDDISPNEECTRPKRKKVDLTIQTVDYSSPLEKGFKFKSSIGCYPNYKEIVDLAKFMGWSTPSGYNPKLVPNAGDFTYWSVQGLQIDQIILQFAARIAAIQSLEREKITLAKRNDRDILQGMLSALADQIVTKTQINKEWSKLKGQGCSTPQTRIISFPLDEQGSDFMIVKWERIEEIKNKIRDYAYPNGGFTITQIKELGDDFFNLNYELQCNDNLYFLDGDFSYYKENFSDDQTLKLLAAFKVLLDAAKYDNNPCKELVNKGNLSNMAVEYIAKKHFGYQ